MLTVQCFSCPVLKLTMVHVDEMVSPLVVNVSRSHKDLFEVGSGVSASINISVRGGERCVR